MTVIHNAYSSLQRKKKQIGHREIQMLSLKKKRKRALGILMLHPKVLEEGL